jgi:hypothetical protein
MNRVQKSFTCKKNIKECTIENRKMKIRKMVKFYEQSLNELCKKK